MKYILSVSLLISTTCLAQPELQVKGCDYFEVAQMVLIGNSQVLVHGACINGGLFPLRRPVTKVFTITPNGLEENKDE